MLATPLQVSVAVAVPVAAGSVEAPQATVTLAGHVIAGGVASIRAVVIVEELSLGSGSLVVAETVAVFWMTSGQTLGHPAIVVIVSDRLAPLRRLPMLQTPVAGLYDPPDVSETYEILLDNRSWT
mgnify:CR=1 FL=1